MHEFVVEDDAAMNAVAYEFQLDFLCFQRGAGLAHQVCDRMISPHIESA